MNLAMVVAYLIAGPLANIISNGKEIARVFACSVSLTANLSRSRVELMAKPFRDGLMHLKSDGNEIKDTIRSLKDVTAPIASEIEDDEAANKIKEDNDYNDENPRTSGKVLPASIMEQRQREEAERYRRKYIEKTRQRCEKQLDKGAQRCRDGFAKAHEACANAVGVWVTWLLCWPMKVTFVCNIAQALGGSKACDSGDDIDAGLGEGYRYLKNSREVLARNFKGVQMQIRLEKVKSAAQAAREVATDAAAGAGALAHDVERNKVILQALLLVFSRLLAFLFVKVLLAAQKYQELYLTSVEHDNCYVTRYFRKIDARRRHRGQSTLLPLKRSESRRLSTLRKANAPHITKGILNTCVHVMMTSVFVIVDLVIVYSLGLVAKHGRMDYTQTGRHDLRLAVKGTGLLANIMRSVLTGFNVKQRIRTVTTNEACLPRPTTTSPYYFWKIYGTFVGVIATFVFQKYMSRLRPVICAYFYRKREKTRILFLYNEMLKKRIGFLRNTQNKIKKLVRQHLLEQNLNVFKVLRIRFPKYCDMLRIFAFARRKCLICSDPEPFNRNKASRTFVECPNPICHFTYCLQCWNEMRQICYACADFDEEPEVLDESDSGLGED